MNHGRFPRTFWNNLITTALPLDFKYHFSFFDNIPSKYHDGGDSISNSTIESDYNLGGTPKMGYITTDIYTSFVLLIGIFFPSCTGNLDYINRNWHLFVVLNYLDFLSWRYPWDTLSSFGTFTLTWLC